MRLPKLGAAFLCKIHNSILVFGYTDKLRVTFSPLQMKNFFTTKSTIKAGRTSLNKKKNHM